MPAAAATLGRIIVQFVAKTDDMDRALAKSQRGISEFAVHIAKLGTAFLTFGATTGQVFDQMLRPMQSAIDLSRKFQTGLNQVTTIMAQGTDAAERYRAGLLKISSTYGVELTNATKALYNAISAGVPEDNVLQVLEAGAKLARVGVTDLDTAITAIRTTLNAYNVDLTKATNAQAELDKVSKSLFAAVDYGTFTFEELSKNIGKFLPLASQTGLALEEVLSVAAALSRTGLNMPQVATGVQNLAMSFLKPTGKSVALVEDLNKQLGLQGDAALSLSQEYLKNHGLIEAMKRFTEATKGNLDILAQVFSRKGAITTVAALIVDGFQNADSAMADTAARVTGLNKEFETMQDLTMELEKTYAKFQRTLVTIGSTQLPIFREILKKVNFELGAFNEALENHPAATKFFATVYAGTALVGKGLSSILMNIGFISFGLLALRPVFRGAITVPVKAAVHSMEELALRFKSVNALVHVFKAASLDAFTSFSKFFSMFAKNNLPELLGGKAFDFGTVIRRVFDPKAIATVTDAIANVSTSLAILETNAHDTREAILNVLDDKLADKYRETAQSARNFAKWLLSDQMPTMLRQSASQMRNDVTQLFKKMQVAADDSFSQLLRATGFRLHGSQGAFTSFFDLIKGRIDIVNAAWAKWNDTINRTATSAAAKAMNAGLPVPEIGNVPKVGVLETLRGLSNTKAVAQLRSLYTELDNTAQASTNFGKALKFALDDLDRLMNAASGPARVTMQNAEADISSIAKILQRLHDLVGDMNQAVPITAKNYGLLADELDRLRGGVIAQLNKELVALQKNIQIKEGFADTLENLARVNAKNFTDGAKQSEDIARMLDRTRASIVRSYTNDLLNFNSAILSQEQLLKVLQSELAKLEAGKMIPIQNLAELLEVLSDRNAPSSLVNSIKEIPDALQDLGKFLKEGDLATKDMVKSAQRLLDLLRDVSIEAEGLSTIGKRAGLGALGSDVVDTANDLDKLVAQLSRAAQEGKFVEGSLIASFQAIAREVRASSSILLTPIGDIGKLSTTFSKTFEAFASAIRQAFSAAGVTVGTFFTTMAKDFVYGTVVIEGVLAAFRTLGAVYGTIKQMFENDRAMAEQAKQTAEYAKQLDLLGVGLNKAEKAQLSFTEAAAQQAAFIEPALQLVKDFITQWDSLPDILIQVTKLLDYMMRQLLEIPKMGKELVKNFIVDAVLGEGNPISKFLDQQIGAQNYLIEQLKQANVSMTDYQKGRAPDTDPVAKLDEVIQKGKQAQEEYKRVQDRLQEIAKETTNYSDSAFKSMFSEEDFTKIKAWAEKTNSALKDVVAGYRIYLQDSSFDIEDYMRRLYLKQTDGVKEMQAYLGRVAKKTGEDTAVATAESMQQQTDAIGSGLAEQAEAWAADTEMKRRKFDEDLIIFDEYARKLKEKESTLRTQLEEAITRRDEVEKQMFEQQDPQMFLMLEQQMKDLDVYIQTLKTSLYETKQQVHDTFDTDEGMAGIVSRVRTEMEGLTSSQQTMVDTIAASTNATLQQTQAQLSEFIRGVSAEITEQQKWQITQSLSALASDETTRPIYDALIAMGTKAGEAVSQNITTLTNVTQEQFATKMSEITGVAIQKIPDAVEANRLTAGEAGTKLGTIFVEGFDKEGLDKRIQDHVTRGAGIVNDTNFQSEWKLGWESAVDNADPGTVLAQNIHEGVVNNPTLWDSIKQKMTDVLGWLTSGANTDEASAWRLEHGGDSGANMRQSGLAYAKGTKFHPGGRAKVGEEGPELVGMNGPEVRDLPRGAIVYNAKDTKKIMKNAGGMPSYATGIGTPDVYQMDAAIREYLNIIGVKPGTPKWAQAYWYYMSNPSQLPSFADARAYEIQSEFQRKQNMINQMQGPSRFYPEIMLDANPPEGPFYQIPGAGGAPTTANNVLAERAQANRDRMNQRGQQLRDRNNLRGGGGGPSSSLPVQKVGNDYVMNGVGKIMHVGMGYWIPYAIKDDYAKAMRSGGITPDIRAQMYYLGTPEELDYQIMGDLTKPMDTDYNNDGRKDTDRQRQMAEAEQQRIREGFTTYPPARWKYKDVNGNYVDQFGNMVAPNGEIWLKQQDGSYISKASGQVKPARVWAPGNPQTVGKAETKIKINTNKGEYHYTRTTGTGNETFYTESKGDRITSFSGDMRAIAQTGKFKGIKEFDKAFAFWRQMEKIAGKYGYSTNDLLQKSGLNTYRDNKGNIDWSQTRVGMKPSKVSDADIIAFHKLYTEAMAWFAKAQDLLDGVKGGKARGGRVLDSGRYIVGEEGPEIVRLEKNSIVMDAHRSRPEMMDVRAGRSLSSHTVGPGAEGRVVSHTLSRSDRGNGGRGSDFSKLGEPGKPPSYTPPQAQSSNKGAAFGPKKNKQKKDYSKFFSELRSAPLEKLQRFVWAIAPTEAERILAFKEWTASELSEYIVSTIMAAGATRGYTPAWYESKWSTLQQQTSSSLNAGPQLAAERSMPKTPPRSPGPPGPGDPIPSKQFSGGGTSFSGGGTSGGNASGGGAVLPTPSPQFPKREQPHRGGSDGGGGAGRTREVSEQAIRSMPLEALKRLLGLIIGPDAAASVIEGKEWTQATLADHIIKNVLPKTPLSQAALSSYIDRASQAIAVAPKEVKPRQFEFKKGPFGGGIGMGVAPAVNSAIAAAIDSPSLDPRPQRPSLSAHAVPTGGSDGQVVQHFSIGSVRTDEDIYRMAQESKKRVDSARRRVS